MSILRLRHREFRAGEFAVMAVVNRTPDSFFDKGRTFGFAAAMNAVDRAVAAGADIVDIGGVKAAGPGAEVVAKAGAEAVTGWRHRRGSGLPRGRRVRGPDQ
jgi:dihydropteroate synthase